MKHADAISHKVNTFPAKILLQAVYLMFLNVQSPVFSSLFCCYVNAQSAVSIVQNLVLHALCNHRRWQTMLKAPAMRHTCVSHCRRADWQARDGLHGHNLQPTPHAGSLQSSVDGRLEDAPIFPTSFRWRRALVRSLRGATRNPVRLSTPRPKSP